MDLKYIKNMNGSTASMFLFSEIGGYGIDGQMFANELKYLSENNVTDVTIHINSGGGSVIDGLSIMRSIQMFAGNITTQIEGVAASIAGVIALGGKKRTMVDFGRIMIHDPSFTNGDHMDEKQKNALNSIREMLIDIFDKNTNIDRAEIDTIMSTETWFDSITALSRGMIDEIISTDRNAENVFDGQTTIAGMVNRANSIHQQLSSKSKINMEMVKNHLSLDAKSTDDAIVNAIKEIENRANNAETENGQLKNSIVEQKTEIDAKVVEIENANTEIEGLKKTVATNVVQNAIDSGKFAAEKKADLIDQALEMGVVNFNKMVEAIKSVPAKITDQLKGGDILTNEKSFRELEKTNPTLLNKIKNTDPETYGKMYFAEYGVELAK